VNESVAAGAGGGTGAAIGRVRRIITGQTADGQSVFTHVEAVPPVNAHDDIHVYRVWGWPELATLPFSSTGPEIPHAGTRRGGTTVSITTIPPHYGADRDEDGDGAPVATQPTRHDSINIHRGGRPDASGFHCTDSVDVGFVISGECFLQQGDGAEELLQPGDVFVQNGAVHAWRNRSDEPFVAGFVQVRTGSDEPGR
jgi:hypothetical protein